MKAKIFVTLKYGVLDPQGKAVAKSLNNLGFKEVNDIRIGKFIEVDINEMDVEEAHARLEAMSKKLLANTVIENFQIEIVKPAEKKPWWQFWS